MPYIIPSGTLRNGVNFPSGANVNSLAELARILDSNHLPVSSPSIRYSSTYGSTISNNSRRPPIVQKAGNFLLKNRNIIGASLFSTMIVGFGVYGVYLYAQNKLPGQNNKSPEGSIKRSGLS